MCSEPKLRALAALPLLALALAVLPLAACGKRGDPTPPPRTVPQPIRDLTVGQRGAEVVLEMGHPKSTLAGLALPALAEVAVYQVTRPAAADGGAPALSETELALAAKPLATLRGAELAGAQRGDRISFRFRLEESAFEPPATARYFAVRTRAAVGEVSPWSNAVALVPRRPPEPPARLEVGARQEGIELSWASPAAPVEGYHVYRREATVPSYGAPLARLGAEAVGHLDTTATYGQRYIYTVCSLAARQPPIESAPAGEREIDYEDRFAPAPPPAVRALASPNEARLLWEPSPDRDVAGYVVFRADPGQEWRRVNAEPVTGQELVDTGLGSGLTFRYRVAAIDHAGNLGEPSEVAEAHVP